MIALTTSTYDLDGVLIVDTPTDFETIKSFRRRSTRVATLDGESVLNDLGFSDSDRTINLSFKATEENHAIAENIVKYYSLVNLYMDSDVFNANPSELRYSDNGTITIILLIISRAN